MGTPGAEIEIDEALVHALLTDQCPHLADLPVRIVANGWDNVITRVGDEWMARLPRRAVAVPLVLHEQQWLPHLAAHLPLPVPVPVHCGTPGAGYPWPWTLTRWLDGSPAATHPPVDPAEAADTLAAFVRAMHRPAPADAPDNPVRGVALRQRADAVEGRLAQLADVVDVDRVRATWDRLRRTPVWDGPPLWLHGDLHPANMLTVDGRLAAVIDFGDLTAGDPATDLAVAWMLFGPAERDRFRVAIGTDDNTWRRAAAWALSLALAYLTADDTTSMPAVGRTTLAAVLAEFG
ncbi:MAG: aminoglycoside phosphotransferase family protein [Ilumatobacteraceae bacterium]